MPIIISAATRVFFRPSLSPKCPNKSDPNGRARNDTAKVTKASSVARTGFDFATSVKKMSPK